MRNRFLSLTALLFGAVLLTTGPASAEPSTDVRWRDEWTRFRPVEYAVTGAAIVGAGTLLLLSPANREPNWTGGILVDDAVRGGLRLPSAEGRRRAQTIGTYCYHGSLAFPFVVDVLGASLIAHRRPDVAAQMALIDAEVFALVGLLNFGITNAVARQRPFGRTCDAGGDPGFPRCTENGRDYQSFFGGHAAVAFASAGLTCAHHQNIPLYGGGAPEILVCAGMLANATAVGWTRMMTDKHYFSDNVVGAVVGLSLGYGIPTLFHYRSKGAGKTRALLRVVPVPSVSATTAGVSMGGAF